MWALGSRWVRAEQGAARWQVYRPVCPPHRGRQQPSCGCSHLADVGAALVVHELAQHIGLEVPNHHARPAGPAAGVRAAGAAGAAAAQAARAAHHRRRLGLGRHPGVRGGKGALHGRQRGGVPRVSVHHVLHIHLLLTDVGVGARCGRHSWPAGRREGSNARCGRHERGGWAYGARRERTCTSANQQQPCCSPAQPAAHARPQPGTILNPAPQVGAPAQPGAPLAPRTAPPGRRPPGTARARTARRRAWWPP